MDYIRVPITSLWYLLRVIVIVFVYHDVCIMSTVHKKDPKGAIICSCRANTIIKKGFLVLIDNIKGP